MGAEQIPGRPRRLPLVGFIQDSLAKRAEYKRQVERARNVGAQIYDARQAEYFNATELSDRVYGAATDQGLSGYSDEIWLGYSQRAKELAELRGEG